MQRTKLLLPFLTFITASLLIISGCSKKNNSGSGSLTVKNIAGTYKFTSYQETELGQTGDPRDNCAKDDLVQFNADSTYNYIDAGTTCSPNGSGTGSWWVAGNYFVLDGDSATINSFNGTTLVLTAKGLDGSNPYTDVITFAKQ